MRPEAATEQQLTVDCFAGTAPFFEHKLTNLQARKQKFTVTCSPCATLIAAHHKGAALELVTDSNHCEAHSRSLIVTYQGSDSSSCCALLT